MKDDLISRRALKDRFKLRIDWLEKDKHDDYTTGIWDGCLYDAELIDAAPTVDAVPVVRCKDCKWYKEGELLAPNKFCFRLMHPTDNRHIGYNFSGDDFCSYGERKDNAGT